MRLNDVLNNVRPVHFCADYAFPGVYSRHLYLCPGLLKSLAFGLAFGHWGTWRDPATALLLMGCGQFCRFATPIKDVILT